MRHDSPLPALVARIRDRDDCRVLAPVGLPDDLVLPDDVAAFYALCGGMVIGVWRIAAPDALVPAAVRLLAPKHATEVLRDWPEDVASTTIVFADQGGGSTDEHVLLDLHPARRGRFYEGFWDSFGVAGSMPVIATSVAGALAWMLDGPAPGASLGDAYET